MKNQKVYFGNSSLMRNQMDIYARLEEYLGKKYELNLPHKHNQHIDTTEIIKNQDIVIAEISNPSTDLGIEMGIAFSCRIPIVCAYKKGHENRSSANFITENFVEYENELDLAYQLENIIPAILRK